MKTKIILLSLLLCIGILSCNENKENLLQEEKLIQKDDSTKKTKDCFKSDDEKLEKKHFFIKGVVTYSVHYKEYIMLPTENNSQWLAYEYLFCPKLDPKYCKEGLKIKASGKLYRGIDPASRGHKGDTRPKGGCLFDVYRFRDYRITEIK